MSGRIHSVNIIILKLVLIFMVSIPLQVSSKQQFYDHFLYEELNNITIRVPVNDVSINSYHLLCEKEGEIIIVDSIIESFSSHDKESICVFLPMDWSPYLISAKYYLDIETASNNHISSDSVVVNVIMPETGLPVMSVKLDEEVSNIQRETYLTAFLTMTYGVDTLFVDEKLKI